MTLFSTRALFLGLVVVGLLASPSLGQQTVVRSPGDSQVNEVGGKTLQQWIDDLKHVDPSVREEAIRAISLFGPPAARAVPGIVERLQDSDSSPRVKAVMALGFMEIRKEDQPKVISGLGVRLMQDTQSVVRYQAAVALNRFGAEARLAQGGLIKGVADTATWEIRHASAFVLRLAGRDAEGYADGQVVRALLGALHDPTFQVRLEAVLALGALGPPKDASLFSLEIKSLQERLTDRDPTVRVWVYIAVMAMDKVTDEAMKAVIKYLKNPDAKVRMQAARGLGSIGNKAKAAIPALEALLSDREVQVVASAAWALAQMDELSGSVRTAMTDLLKHPDPPFRAAIAQALGAAGKKARATVPALIELVKDKEQPPFVLATACWALGSIGDKSEPTTAALLAVNQRKDVDTSVKQVVQDALDQIKKAKN